jgi:hypothetical protein
MSGNACRTRDRPVPQPSYPDLRSAREAVRRKNRCGHARSSEASLRSPHLTGQASLRRVQYRCLPSGRGLPVHYGCAAPMSKSLYRRRCSLSSQKPEVRAKRLDHPSGMRSPLHAVRHPHAQHRACSFADGASLGASSHRLGTSRMSPEFVSQHPNLLA